MTDALAGWIARLGAGVRAQQWLGLGRFWAALTPAG